MSLSESVSPSVAAPSAERLSPAQRVTPQIKAALERGVRPWIKPWDDAAPGFVLPRRSNGLAYRGVNVVALWAASVENGCAEGERVTLDGGRVLTRLARDGAGRMLPAWASCRTLGPDDVFLLGDTADSFDRRYWGPVRLGRIDGVWRPLF